jgi:hypothetical protein
MMIMKREYDFSKAARGKFHRSNAKFNLPVYLDADVREFVTAIAKKKRTDPSDVVNMLLKNDMRLARDLK